MKQTLVDWLFERFSIVWDKKWTDKIEGIEKQKREVWADAIENITRKQLENGVKTASRTLIWPPEIPEFINLCVTDSTTVIDNRITADKAMEIAEKKIRGRFTPRNYTETICERDALIALQAKILRDQNDTADLTFCNATDCFKFVIAKSQFCWYCQDHTNQQEKQ